ncbi:MAG: GNAT family N-acetyltransferase [Planctomycetes bacterium]|nr:GNAT family N-acetyltransferase [Planctomycetota bacterium]
MSDYARCMAFLRRGDLGGAREAPSPVGVGVVDEALALRHDSNYLLVERPDATPADVAAELARLGLPMALVPDHVQGERLAAALPGWGVHRGLVMVHRRPPDRPAPAAVVREVDVEDLRAARGALLTEQPWATDAVIAQLLDAKAAIARRVALRAFAALVDGALASYTDLYLADGVAQVEDVATLPSHRGRGLARAVVLRAVDEARAAGAGLVFLVAAEDDWPKALYRRLGFDEVGVYVKLTPPARGHSGRRLS